MHEKHSVIETSKLPQLFPVQHYFTLALDSVAPNLHGHANCSHDTNLILGVE